MASGFSVYAADRILDKVLKDTAFTTPTSYYLALFTHATQAAAFLRANNAASAVEVSSSGTGYARVQVRGATGIQWAASSNGSTAQNLEVAFAQAAASWGTIYAAALMDAPTGGNVWTYADLSPPRVITSPDVFRVPAGQFILTL